MAEDHARRSFSLAIARSLQKNRPRSGVIDATLSRQLRRDTPVQHARGRVSTASEVEDGQEDSALRCSKEGAEATSRTGTPTQTNGRERPPLRSASQGARAGTSGTLHGRGPVCGAARKHLRHRGRLTAGGAVRRHARRDGRIRRGASVRGVSGPVERQPRVDLHEPRRCLRRAVGQRHDDHERCLSHVRAPVRSDGWRMGAAASERHEHHHLVAGHRAEHAPELQLSGGWRRQSASGAEFPDHRAD